MGQIRAGIYLRQSLDRHGDLLAVDRQRDDCEKLCADRGWTCTGYVDNDTSATTGRRRDYERMLADIRAGSIDAVVAWDADRLHRRPIELEQFIDLADEKGLALATVGGDFDLSTPTGRGNARMKGVFARMEIEQKTARQKRAARQLAEHGRQWWPSRPFGFLYDDGVPVLDADGNPVTHPRTGRPRFNPPPRPVLDGDGRLRLDRAEAKLIRDAYTSVLAGRSLKSIARDWNAKAENHDRDCRIGNDEFRRVASMPLSSGIPISRTATSGCKKRPGQPPGGRLRPRRPLRSPPVARVRAAVRGA